MTKKNKNPKGKNKNSKLDNLILPIFAHLLFPTTLKIYPTFFIDNNFCESWQYIYIYNNVPNKTNSIRQLGKMETSFTPQPTYQTKSIGYYDILLFTWLLPRLDFTIL